LRRFLLPPDFELLDLDPLDLEPVDLTVGLTAVFLPVALPTAKVVNGALLLSFRGPVITVLESN
jgi:hypothetical protein